MDNFVKCFIQENKISLFAHLHILANSSKSMISCVSQDLFSRNPCCKSYTSSSVKCLAMLEATMCSKTLQRTQVSEMGL